jgi:hypothetical protein
LKKNPLLIESIICESIFCLQIILVCRKCHFPGLSLLVATAFKTEYPYTRMQAPVARHTMDSDLNISGRLSLQTIGCFIIACLSRPSLAKQELHSNTSARSARSLHQIQPIILYVYREYTNMFDVCLHFAGVRAS